eukprot:2724868-Amphidinium_carterae.1
MLSTPATRLGCCPSPPQTSVAAGDHGVCRHHNGSGPPRYQAMCRCSVYLWTARHTLHRRDTALRTCTAPVASQPLSLYPPSASESATSIGWSDVWRLALYNRHSCKGVAGTSGAAGIGWSDVWQLALYNRHSCKGVAGTSPPSCQSAMSIGWSRVWRLALYKRHGCKGVAGTSPPSCRSAMSIGWSRVWRLALYNRHSCKGMADPSEHHSATRTGWNVVCWPVLHIQGTCIGCVPSQGTVMCCTPPTPELKLNVRCEEGPDSLEHWWANQVRHVKHPWSHYHYLVSPKRLK